MKENIENISEEIDVTKKRNKIEIIKLASIIGEINNSLDGLSSREEMKEDKNQ